MLQRMRNSSIKLKSRTKNIGGNELLMDEMIARNNAKKGYISKMELLNIQMMNLTMIAAAQAHEKKRQQELFEKAKKDT